MGKSEKSPMSFQSLVRCWCGSFKNKSIEGNAHYRVLACEVLRGGGNYDKSFNESIRVICSFELRIMVLAEEAAVISKDTRTTEVKPKAVFW